MYKQILLAAALLAGASASFAQMRPSADALLDKADANHDGSVSRSEFLAARAQQFSRLDRNGDGRISQQELAQGPTPDFDQADADHDGALNAQELAAAKEMAKSSAAAMRQE